MQSSLDAVEAELADARGEVKVKSTQAELNAAAADRVDDNATRAIAIAEEVHRGQTEIALAQDGVEIEAAVAAWAVGLERLRARGPSGDQPDTTGAA